MYLYHSQVNHHYRVYNRYLQNLFKKTFPPADGKSPSRMCKAHEFLSKKANYSKLNKDAPNFSTDPFNLKTNLAEFATCLGYLSVQSSGHGHVGKYFKQFLSFMPNLKGLQLVKCGVKNMDGIGQCNKLNMLDLADNQIQEIPAELADLMDTLTSFNVRYVNHCFTLKFMVKGRRGSSGVPGSPGLTCFFRFHG